MLFDTLLRIDSFFSNKDCLRIALRWIHLILKQRTLRDFFILYFQTNHAAVILCARRLKQICVNSFSCVALFYFPLHHFLWLHFRIFQRKKTFSTEIFVAIYAAYKFVRSTANFARFDSDLRRLFACVMLFHLRR